MEKFRDEQIQVDKNGRIKLSQETVNRYFSHTKQIGSISDIIQTDVLNRRGLDPSDVLLNPQKFGEEDVHPEIADDGETLRTAFARHILEIEQLEISTQKELIHEFDVPEKVADRKTLNENDLSLQEVFNEDELNQIGNMWIELYCHPDEKKIAIVPTDGNASDRFKLEPQHDGSATIRSEELIDQGLVPEIRSHSVPRWDDDNDWVVARVYP